MSSIRSQTVEADIDSSITDNIVRKSSRVFERFLRGGAMVYTQWYSETQIKQELKKRKGKASIANNIHLRKYWYKENHHVPFCLIKVAEIENIIKNM